MKKTLLMILMLTLVSFAGMAQSKGGSDKSARAKEFLEFKIKYLSDEMGLTGEERQKFVNLYTQYGNEKRVLWKKAHDLEKKIKEKKNATEAEYEEWSKAKAKIDELEASYDKKFSNFLTSKQIYKMKSAEEQFKQKMRDCRDKKKGEKSHKK